MNLNANDPLTAAAAVLWEALADIWQSSQFVMMLIAFGMALVLAGLALTGRNPFERFGKLIAALIVAQLSWNLVGMLAAQTIVPGSDPIGELDAPIDAIENCEAGPAWDPDC